MFFDLCGGDLDVGGQLGTEAARKELGREERRGARGASERGTIRWASRRRLDPPGEQVEHSRVRGRAAWRQCRRPRWRKEKEEIFPENPLQHFV